MKTICFTPRIHRLALSATILAFSAIPTASAATISYQNLILNDNPIVYYQFDETSGTNAENFGSAGATLRTRTPFTR